MQAAVVRFRKGSLRDELKDLLENVKKILLFLIV